MRYLALCCDYDGTLAHHGQLDAPTIAALERLKASGRFLIMVTGRELDELKTVCSRLDLFDQVVAENGALLYRPDTGEERSLGKRPPDDFVAALKSKGVERISVGRVIVATWEPHQNTVLETIHDMHLELQVIFNKGAVMILPTGINKASGLRAALKEMKSRYGDKIYGRYGFADAFDPHDGWVNRDVIGIDLGITLLSAENLRSGKVWHWFMLNDEVRIAMRRAELL